MTYYIINKNNNYLASNITGSFCQGIIGFSKKAALNFQSLDEAKEYISYLKKELEKWFTEDIQDQSKNWSDSPQTPVFNQRKTFLKKSEERFLKNKKIIESLKITENLNLN
jgi:hypothetical protein